MFLLRLSPVLLASLCWVKDSLGSQKHALASFLSYVANSLCDLGQVTAVSGTHLANSVKWEDRGLPGLHLVFLVLRRPSTPCS